MTAACTRETEQVQPSREQELKAITAILPQVGSVTWTEGDGLAVYDGLTRYSLSAGQGGSVRSTFACELPPADSRYAAFPDSPSVEFTSVGQVRSEILTAQTPLQGGYDRKAATLLARSGSDTFALEHLCGFVRVTLKSDNIASIRLRGRKGETLTGHLSAYYDKQGQLQSTVSQGADHLTAYPAVGDAFAPGDYYLAVLPVNLEEGYELVFTRTDDPLCATRTVHSPGRVIRGSVLQTGVVDEGLSWTEDLITTISVPFLIGLSGATRSWPFKESLPEGTATTTPAYAGTPVVFHLPSSGTPAFEVFAETGIAHVTKSSEGLKIMGSSKDYILLPAIKDRYLTQVTIRSGGTGAMRSARIVSADGKDVIDGGSFIPVSFSEAGEEWTWRLRGTKQGQSYRISFPVPGTYNAGADYSAKIQELRLYYSPYPSEEPSVEVQPVPVLRDTVPDFSRVGYHSGDDPLPVYPVVRTLNPPADGADATALIQSAIDATSGPGAILLKAGTWNVEGLIYLDKSGIVLRGEGESTVIRACGKRGYKLNDVVIQMGHRNSTRVLDRSTATPIVEDAVCGQFYVKVQNPLHFLPGDRVVVYRRPTQEWINAIKMDMYGWNPNAFNLYWERVVTSVEGNCIWLDNPLVMSVTEEFGGGSLIKCSWDRISESGIEQIHFDSDYDETLYDDTSLYAIRWGRYQCDEDHAWNAINIRAAENCWVSGVSAIHYAGSTVDMMMGSYHITVENCASRHPISTISGSRRYAFHFHQCCEVSLVKNCTADMDRHAFVTGFGNPGPNVFTRCTATNMYEDVGPHHHWATGTLYDVVQADFNIAVQDRADAGDGHGWAGANYVLWNCDIIPRIDGNKRTGRFVCQNPWASARNWAFGCGPAEAVVNTTRTYSDGLIRQDGEIISAGVHMEQPSLYEWQLSLRKGSR